MTNTAIGRTELAILTNKSGGSVAQGDVVVVDTTTASSFTTNTAGAYVSGRIGVVWDASIANNASGLVAFSGYVPIINLSGTGSIGDIIKTHTVAKQGVRHAAPQVAGDFAQALGTSATPAALLFGTVQLGGGSGIARSGTTTDAHVAIFNGTNADSIKDGGIAGLFYIDEKSGNGSSGTLSFTSIPSTYRHLVIKYVVRSDKSASTFESMKIQINGDTTASNYRYTRTFVYGTGSGTTGTDTGDDSVIDDIPAATAVSGGASEGEIQINYYKDTTFNKQIIDVCSNRRDSSSVHEIHFRAGVEWESTSAITQIDLVLASGKFITGSKATLYGLA